MGCGTSYNTNPHYQPMSRGQVVVPRQPMIIQQQPMVVQQQQPMVVQQQQPMSPNNRQQMQPAQQTPIGQVVQPRHLPVGTPVQLHSLVSATHLNGAQGLVLQVVQVFVAQNNRTEARYRVQMPDGGHLDLSPNNVQTLTDQQMNTQLRQMKAFCPGKVVTLTGLVVDTLLNGQRGMVMGGPFARAGGRYRVKMHNGKLYDMAPKNIEEFSIPTFPMEKRVAIQGMQTNKELNNAHCRILAPLDPKTMRYYVALEDDDGNPDNDIKLSVAPYNLIDVAFLPGQKVLLQNLQRDQTLNGAMGIVSWGPFDNGRYSVAVQGLGSGPQQLLLRPLNLMVCPEHTVAKEIESFTPTGQQVTMEQLQETKAEEPPPLPSAPPAGGQGEGAEEVHKKLMADMALAEETLRNSEANANAEAKNNLQKALEMRRKQRAMRRQQTQGTLIASD